jgi:hypothetical protein
MRLAFRIVLACLAVGPGAAARAQQPPASSADSLRLGNLHKQAVAGDPRQHQFTLLAQQTDLRLRNLAAERLPSLSAEVGAQYQSAVFTPGSLAGGATFPTPAKDTYENRVSIEQSIIDPTFATFVTLLLVPVLYAIFVLDLKIVKWEASQHHE